MILGVLGRYFALSFTKTVLAVFGGVFVLIFTIDTVETLRRSGDSAGETSAMVAWLAFLHTPIVAEQVMPFAALLGSMLAFLNHSRRLELVVARAAGVSVWQFLAPALMVAVALGVIEIAVYNPLSTWMKRQSEVLEAQFQVGPAKSGIGSWFSQQSVDGRTIVHAERAGDSVFAHFQAFNFDPDGKFSQRVDAERAILRDGFWELQNTTVVAPGFDTQTVGVFLLATNLSARDVSQAFTAPDTVSFWNLSALADQMDRAGFDGAPYRLRFQQLLAMPAMLAAMVLLASCFSLRLFRMGGIQKMISGGVGAGFVLYVATKIVGDLGGVGAVNPVVAGWLPATVGSLIGVFVLLLQEDG
jgi:lipopolysaccharide export system permease protein